MLTFVRQMIGFQSTLPAGGATRYHVNKCTGNSHFNPRSPRGERLPTLRTCGKEGLFQSTLPAGGATKFASLPIDIKEISIHAPRGGSDNCGWHSSCKDCIFQSTLPAGGATELPKLSAEWIQAFQSTLPAGGATQILRLLHRGSSYFNPRSPRGERHNLKRAKVLQPAISIHAPRGGSDFVKVFQ